MEDSMAEQHDFPSLDEIYRNVDDLVARHPDIVRAESLGNSAEGRPVRGIPLRCRHRRQHDAGAADCTAGTLDGSGDIAAGARRRHA